MRPNRTLEIGTGLFVLLGFATLLFLTAQLPANGLKFGAPVTMAGVRVGEVAGIRFDSRDYKAVVSLRIDPLYKQIPEDSFASIETQGLLGGKYVGISPGGADSYLREGGRIDQTQSAIVLESLINKFFANYSSKGGGDGQGNAADNQSKAESKK